MEDGTLFGERYWKLSACGNTAVAMQRPIKQPSGEEVSAILSRGSGGLDADNLLLFATRGCPKGLDIVVDGFNRDGSRVGLCGNGARGLIYLAVHLGLLDPNKSSFEMLMDDTRVSLRVQDLSTASISLLVQPPSFDPDTVPFTGDASHGSLTVAGRDFEYVVANVGNPQCILYVEEPPTRELMQQVGEELGEDTERFPNRVNISLCCIESPSQVTARIYERGVGISPSSGTGSIAIATASRSFKGLESEIEVIMPGGAQKVRWSGGGSLVEASTTIELLEEGVLAKERQKKAAAAA